MRPPLLSSQNDLGPVFRVVSLWSPVVVCMAVIFYVSSMNDVPLPEDVSDKTGHLFAYTVLGLTAVRAAAGGLPRRITMRTAAIAIALTVGYGASDELHQMFVGGRSAELADLGADAGGAVLAAIACWAWGIISPRREPYRGHDDL